MTLVANEPLLLPRMDTDITLAGLASGMAVPIRAEYTRGVHDAPPGCAWKTLPRGVCLDPRLLYNCISPRFGAALPAPLAPRLIDIKMPLMTRRRSIGFRPGPPGCHLGGGRRSWRASHCASLTSVG